MSSSHLSVSRVYLLPLVTAGALIVSACGGGSEDESAGENGSSAPVEEVDDSSEAAVPSGGGSVDLADICALLSETAVEEAVGFDVTPENVVSGSTGGNCNYNADEGRIRVGLGDLSEFGGAAADGMDSEIEFTEGAGFTVERIDGLGDQAFRFDGLEGPSSTGGDTSLVIASGVYKVSLTAERGADESTLRGFAETILAQL